ncbi:MAG: alpha-amylase [Treponema sp.]|nr:alpha-amylase [Treponema sp.]
MNFSDKLKFDVSDFGFKKGFFRTWSPSAKKVSLLLYKSFEDVKAAAPVLEFELKADDGGVWKSRAFSDSELSSFLYYKYRFTFENAEYEVCDIWAKCASKESLASRLCDIKSEKASFPEKFSQNYYNPFGKTGSERKCFTDAVIFEMHVRDWSRTYVRDSCGKFTEIACNEKLMDHLKELGVTHVQILPAFEYANSCEDKSYNWGYDPFNFNIPCSRYTREGFTDGVESVRDFRQMIQAFHDKGIAVNMDVVYNHTFGTGKDSIYDMTEPYYFYRTKTSEKGQLEYYNGSGCGNEIASNQDMVRAFIIDSLKHWMTDFHINGFRFDLMGVFETSTMKEIYEELKKIDSNVLVYGEPWCGGECGVKNGCAKPVLDECEGVACFNDDFRDAIKGAEFSGFKKGEVQGVFNDAAICRGLTGSLKKNGGFTVNSNRTINYVECHDNFTLFDKLSLSWLNRTEFSGDLYKEIGEAGLETVKKQDMLSAAYVILAQGIPFINGGQEFMRTKMGDENSYISSDEINQIDFSFKEKNADVFNVYKGLFALRRQNPEAFGHNENASAQVLKEGLVFYQTGNFGIIFNASAFDFTETVEGYRFEVDITSGAVEEKIPDFCEDGKITVTIKALSFMILKVFSK